MEPTRPIRFVHRGQIVEVEGCHPTRTVLEWLREDARRTGTKEGCAEGDCGACTVIVAELAPTDRSGTTATLVGGLSLRPVNSCIRLLPTLDGKALLTVEDLGRADALHPVQQAMVECHGSQCGFCTPGFVMTMTNAYERHCEAGTRPSRRDMADELAGNLCRCTGYRPILDAAQRMFELPVQRLDAAPIVALLQTLRADPLLHYAAPNPAAGGRVDHFHAPRTVEHLAALRAQQPQAIMLAGSTDVGLWVTKQFRDLGALHFLGDVAELQTIARADGHLTLGAGVTLEDAWHALAAEWPDLAEVGERFAGPPVRHAGTLGGNVANGSPIGDGAPVLMALDATLLLRLGERTRELRLDGFYLDYMKNRLEPGEFLQAIRVPLPAPGVQVRAYKISKRFDCDISSVLAALALTLDAGRVAQVRVAFGGMAAVVKRAALAEAAMLGQPWTEATLQAACDALDRDFAPITDLRASADYRRRVARSLLRRFWLETRPDAPLKAHEVTVWAKAWGAVEATT